MADQDTAGGAVHGRLAHNIFLIFLCLVAAALSYLIVRPFVKPIAVSLLLAIICYPLHLRVRGLLRWPGLAAIVSTITVLLSLILPFLLLGATLRRELADLYRMLGEQSAQDGGWGPWLTHASERLAIWLQQNLGLTGFDLRSVILDRLRAISGALLREAADSLGNLAAFIVNGTITFFTLFFLFRDGRLIFRRLAAIIPLRPGQLVRLREEMRKAITASFYGGLAVAVAQGTLTGLAFLILGFSSPILWAVAAALMSFVPLVGPTLVWGPAAVYLLIDGHWLRGLLLIAWGAGVVGLADNIVRPWIISEQVRFYPLFVFIALLGGVQVFGFLGLFAGPAVLALAQALFNLIREESRARRAERG